MYSYVQPVCLEDANMAPINDDVSDGEQHKSSNSSDLKQFYYKCCVKKACKTLLCVNCDGPFHKSCAESRNIKIVSDTRVLCCSVDENAAKGDQHVADNISDTGDIELLKLQVNYLSRLLAESNDKNEVLKENNRLLLQRINFLESNQNMENPVVNNHPSRRQVSTLSTQKTDKNDTKEPNSVTVVPASCEKSEILQPGKDSRTDDGRQNNRDVNKGGIQIEQTDPKSQHPRKNARHKSNNKEILDSKDDEKPNGGMDDQSDYRVVRPKRRRFAKKRLGTGNIPPDAEQRGFTGADRKVWLNIYRVSNHVTVDMVTKYIKKQTSFENEKVDVKELPVKFGSSKSFLVTAPLVRKDEMYEPSFWPRDVGIRRFKPELYRDDTEVSGFFG